MSDPTQDPAVQKALVESDSLAAQFQTYAVTSPEQYTNAAEELKRIKGAAKRLEEMRTAITTPINEGLKRLNEMFKAPAERLAKAEATIKSALLTYSREQERIQREEQARIDEEARKQREKLEAQAAKATASGKVEKAAVLEERAATTVAPVVNRAPPAVKGISTSKVWKFEITDPSQVSAAFMVPDEAKIRKTVQALKGDARGLLGAGVRVYEEEQLSAGAA